MVYPFGQRAVVLLSSPRPLSALVLLHWTNSSSSVSLPLGSVSLHSSRFEESTVSSVAIFREFLMGLHRSLLRACVVPLWPRCAITLTAVKKIKANFAIGKLAVEGSTLYICWNCFSENTQKILNGKIKTVQVPPRFIFQAETFPLNGTDCFNALIWNWNRPK